MILISPIQFHNLDRAKWIYSKNSSKFSNNNKVAKNKSDNSMKNPVSQNINTNEEGANRSESEILNHKEESRLSIFYIVSYLN